MTLATYSLRTFIFNCVVLAMAYPAKKNEVSSFIRAKVMEGSHYLKSRSRDPGHAPFRVIHHPLCSICHDLYNKEKMKCLASSVQKLWRAWSQNLTSRSPSRDLGHAPSGVIYHPLCSTRHGRTNKEKRSL